MARPITYPVTITLRLRPQQMATIRALAEASDRPPSALARRLLLDALERLGGHEVREE